MNQQGAETVTQGIYFCPDGNTARSMQRMDISKEQREAIHSLHALDKRWNVVVPFHFAVWLCAAWGAINSDVVLIDIVCFFIGGLGLSTLSVLAHESSHNLFTRNPRLDRWVGRFCAMPILFSATGYRIIHPQHHKNARTPDDPDDIESTSSNPHLLALLYFVVLVFGVYLYLMMVPAKAIQRASTRDRFVIASECVIMVALLVSAWFVFGTSVMIEAWLIPLLIAGQIANVRGLAEHGLTSSGNEFADTRTVLTHPVLSFLMCHINYHLEHHLYPGVPWYNLPKVHRILAAEFREAGSSVYGSYRSFLMDVFKAVRFGVVPGRRLIPAHIREDICL